MHKTEKRTIDQHLFSLCDIDKITLKNQLLLKVNSTRNRLEHFFQNECSIELSVMMAVLYICLKIVANS